MTLAAPSRLALLVPLGLFLAACGSSGPTGTTVTEAQVTGAHVTEAQVTATRICEAISGRGGPPAPGTPCPSPDGAWSVTYRGNGQRGSLRLSHLGSASVRAYHSTTQSCCQNVTWARPHTLLFIDDFQIFRLDPVTRRHTNIAGGGNFVVSRNGRWLAVWDDVPETRSRVSVLSVHGNTCLVVPHLADETDNGVGFSEDGNSVVVGRGSFDLGNYGIGPTGSVKQRRRLARRPRGLVAFKISSLPSC